MSSILLKPQNKKDYFSTQTLHKRLRKGNLTFKWINLCQYQKIRVEPREKHKI
jgi:hypothetical protein